MPQRPPLLGKHPPYCTCVKCLEKLHGGLAEQSARRNKPGTPSARRSRRSEWRGTHPDDCTCAGCSIARRQEATTTYRPGAARDSRRRRGSGCLGLRFWIILVILGFAAVAWSVETCGPRLSWEANYMANMFRTGEFAQAGQNKQQELADWEAEQAEKKRSEQERLIADIETNVVQLTNFERSSRGLRPLRHDPAIAAIARAHSENMLAQENLSHTLDGLDSNDRARVNGYNCRRDLGGGRFEFGLAENITHLDGYGKGSAAKEMVAGWMTSPGHRKNILDPGLERIGVGVANEGDKWYGTQNFSSCQ